MKIASVTFFPEKNSAGGAQTPAIAFYEWCLKLNQDCDLIGITENVNRGLVSEIKKFCSPVKMPQILNEYDFIFFQTPPYPSHIDLSEIKKPFFCMMNGESEIKLYGKENIHNTFNHEMCRGLIALGSQSEEINSLHENQINWFPPALPDSLTNKAYLDRGSIFLCASRVARNKNVILFNEVANKLMPLTEGAELHGRPSSKEMDRMVRKTLGAVTYYDEAFNRDELFKKNRFGFIWGISGSLNHHIKMKRLALNCIEAFNYGIMPIVNENHLPKELKGAFINYEPYFMSTDSISHSMILYKNNIESWYERSRKIVEESSYSYQEVKEQVKNIIKEMEKSFE